MASVNRADPEKRSNWLNEDQRQEICLILLQNCNEKLKPKHGIIKTLCSKYGVSRQTVRRLWDDAKKKLQGSGTLDVCRKMVGTVGRKSVEFDLVKLKKLAMGDRSTVRMIGHKLGVSKSYIHNRVRDGTVRRHSSALKPYLRDSNKYDRVEFCLSKIESSTMFSNPRFIDFNDYIHVDEKLFYITKEASNVYLLPEEMDPERSCQSKRFITKVMFLVAVARPRYDPSKGVEFDGKIDCWPFIYEEPAKRGSKNRPTRTLETKPLLSVTRPVYRAYLIEKLLPAIREKWPHSTSEPVIYVQQDNPRPHILIDDEDIRAAAMQIGLNVRLVCQPPNSLDMNMLDLGWFRAIESLQQKQNMKDLDEVVDAVRKAFRDLPSSSLNYVFISLQLIMVEVMKCKGGNGYKLPHINKNGLDRLGILPNKISMDCDVIEDALEYLIQ